MEITKKQFDELVEQGHSDAVSVVYYLDLDALNKPKKKPVKINGERKHCPPNSKLSVGVIKSKVREGTIKADVFKEAVCVLKEYNEPMPRTDLVEELCDRLDYTVDQINPVISSLIKAGNISCSVNEDK